VTASPDSPRHIATSARQSGLQRRIAGELALERTRLLYQGAGVPTLFMLLTGLACTHLLWSPDAVLLLPVWLLWLVSLATLCLMQIKAFNRALPSEQARPRWRRSFLLGACASGATLSIASIALVPADDLVLQTLVFGVIAAAILSASVAYAVKMSAFLAFSLPCLLPSAIYLLNSEHELQRGWGALALILLLALLLVAWQVNRRVQANLMSRFENQSLVETLEHARSRAEGLNSELAREVEQRRRAERELRRAHDELEQRVAERTEELAKASSDLHKSQDRLALSLEVSGLGLWDWDLQTDTVHHSRVEEIFGVKSEKDIDLRSWVHEDDKPLLRHALVSHIKGEAENYAVEYRLQHADGRWIWIEDRGRVVERDADGRALRMIGTRRNIDDWKQREREQRLAGTVFEAASEGIMILDPSYRILSVNDAFTQVTGYSRADVIDRRILGLSPEQEARRQYRLIRQELQASGSWQGEFMERRKNGELYPQLLQVKVVHDQYGELSHIVCFMADLSIRRNAEERLRFLSHYDELTGLANRSLFKERLQEGAQRARQTGRSLALLHVDLDRFKLLNDSLGHEIADQVLRHMSRRLTQAVPEANTLARLSGDEFVVLLDSYSSLSSLARLTSRLLDRLRQPMEVGGQELVMSASIGISLLPDNARDVSALVSQANMAMQQAKHLGGNTFQFFTDNLRASTLERLQMETQLRKAIEEGQLEVHYQPKLNLLSECIESVEALVRWRHPERGLVAPGEFIGLAEETGLINPIGEFVLRRACQQVREWQQQGLTLRVSVNLSVHQLRQGNLTTLVRQVLDETGLAAGFLELELTESQLLDNVENVIVIFQQLRDLGVKLAIDDFGTGFSSLSYLKRFPADCVKIDQSFIRDLPANGEDAAITRAIIDLAHSLGLSVVAEGVETSEQLAFLRLQQCDEVQGYLISRPAAPELIEELLQAQQPSHV
jgi:diguanylate cyclase (GGDEF)-like protein/PAS domain S-box-containing protein